MLWLWAYIDFCLFCQVQELVTDRRGLKDHLCHRHKGLFSMILGTAFSLTFLLAFEAAAAVRDSFTVTRSSVLCTYLCIHLFIFIPSSLWELSRSISTLILGRTQSINYIKYLAQGFLIALNRLITNSFISCKAYNFHSFFQVHCWQKPWSGSTRGANLKALCPKKALRERFNLHRQQMLQFWIIFSSQRYCRSDFVGTELTDHIA